MKRIAIILLATLAVAQAAQAKPWPDAAPGSNTRPVVCGTEPRLEQIVTTIFHINPNGSWVKISSHATKWFWIGGYDPTDCRYRTGQHA